jgi:hypothetical protein
MKYLRFGVITGENETVSSHLTEAELAEGRLRRDLVEAGSFCPCGAHADLSDDGGDSGLHVVRVVHDPSCAALWS